MWREVLALALLTSLNPIMLAFVLLVISRPRPVQNLLAFWTGCVAVNVPCFLAALIALHWIPGFVAVAHELATPKQGSGVKPFQLGTGVVALLIAAVMAVRLRLPARTKEPALVGGSAAADSDHRDKREATGLRGRIRRLVDRGRTAWDNGSLWVSVVFGLGYVPPPVLVVMVSTVIVASGAPIGTQIIAVAAFVGTMLAVLEVALVSYLVAPGRTQAVLRPLHDWSKTRRRQILLALFTVVGLWQVATGVGVV